MRPRRNERGPDEDGGNGEMGKWAGVAGVLIECEDRTIMIY